MFDDISKLEEEVKVFRQNILASSQLVEGIDNLVEDVQKQQELMKQVSNDYQNAMRSIADKTIENIERLESDSSREIKGIVESETSNAVQQISNANQAYVNALANADASINAATADLSEKYKQFSDRMESVQFDEVLKTCSDLKKSIELKTNLAIVGIIIVIALEIIQLVIR